MRQVVCIAMLALLSRAGSLHAETILVLGDSNSAGGAEAWPARLETLLDAQFDPKRFRVVNRAKSGLRAAELPGLLREEPWLDANPDLVLILIGGNDLWKLAGKPSFTTLADVVERTSDAIQEAIDLSRAHLNPNGTAPRVIVSGYLPNKLPELDVRGVKLAPNFVVPLLNGMLEARLVEHTLFLDANYREVVDPRSHKARAELMRDDVHLNDAGRQIVAENFLEAILEVLGEPLGN